MMTQLKRFNHDAVDLHYQDVGPVNRSEGGDSDVTLLFVHGMFCNHQDWRYQIDRLAERWRCVALDLRGHGSSQVDGRSDNNDSTDLVAHADIERMGRDVSALAESLDLHNTVLIGHSMGCRIVHEANRHIRDRVAGLVLVDGSRMIDNIDDAKEVSATLTGIDFDRFAKRLFEQMFTPDSNAEFKAQVMQRLTTIPHAFGKTLFANMLSWDASRMDTVFGQANQPLFVVQSTQVDENRRRHPLGASDTSPWLDYLTGFTSEDRIHRLSDVGHFPQVDAHETTNELLVNIVGQVVAKDSTGQHP